MVQVNTTHTHAQPLVPIGLLLIMALRVEWSDLARADPHRALAAAVAATIQEKDRRAA